MDYYKQFEEKFNETFTSIFHFIDDLEYEPKNPLNAVLIENNDEESYDSYGYEDSSLERIYQFPDFGNIYVKFYGTRCSYQGEEWDGFKEVKPKTITISKFE